uniref:Uncharacterized protein n=1 Tax=Anguilla anguilla TaxID=7936 RepID=A0A0E9UAR4_ANGAN
MQSKSKLKHITCILITPVRETVSEYS